MHSQIVTTAYGFYFGYYYFGNGSACRVRKLAM